MPPTSSSAPCPPLCLLTADRCLLRVVHSDTPYFTFRHAGLVTKSKSTGGRGLLEALWSVTCINTQRTTHMHTAHCALRTAHCTLTRRKLKVAESYDLRAPPSRRQSKLTFCIVADTIAFKRRGIRRSTKRRTILRGRRSGVLGTWHRCFNRREYTSCSNAF